MSCEHWLPMLLQAAEDGLDAMSASERDTLRAHLAQCAECREALEAQRVVRMALTSREDAVVPHGFAARVVAQTGVDSSVIDVFRWRTWTYRLAPVAAGLLLFGVVTARNASQAVEPVGLSDLTEVWAFGEQDADARPAFTILGQDDVSGNVLLDAILSAEPDEPLTVGEPS